MQTVICERLEAIRQRIRDLATEYGREAESIRLLAVSKGQPLGAIEQARQAGQLAFGESYINEAKLALAAFPDLDWHFIGPLQSNKTRVVAEQFTWVHSIDRVKIVQRLQRQRPAELAPLNVCIQLNVDDESSKSGVSPDELATLADAVSASSRLCLRGIMAIPRPASDLSQQRHSLARVAQHYQQLKSDGYPLDTLSMGMSGDMEAAIAEGSTLVRVGSAIFGPRSRAGRVG
ncbi:MAG: YggS family pyridoxal phosphate enzyme [Lysobacteraceae bacterium]|nr:MAG: YggS family pyridoxal phosphate enzyme [Xanthomonadaceae bacterium]